MNKPTSKSNERPMVSEELQVQNTEQEQRQRPENGNTRRWWTTGPRHTTVDDRGPRGSSRDYRRARGTTEDHAGESMAVVRQPAPAGGLPPPRFHSRPEPRRGGLRLGSLSASGFAIPWGYSHSRPETAPPRVRSAVSRTPDPRRKCVVAEVHLYLPCRKGRPPV